MSDNSDDDIAGYCKPPRKSRFQKGRSGNPKGRPKGSKNFASIVLAALNESVIANENGRRKRITKLEAAVKQLVNRAAAGEPRPLNLLLSLAQAVEPKADAAEAPLSNEADQELMRQLYARTRSTNENSDE